MTPRADLLTRIDAWGLRAPARIAHRSGEQVLTWGELITRSDALAAHLVSLGLPSEQPVVLRGHKESEMLVGFLGCAKAGHPYVPVDVSVPEARLERIIAASGATLVLTPRKVRVRSAGTSSSPPRRGGPESAHYVMFTSGSTGEPKGVVITRGCLEAFLDWTLAEQRFTDEREVFLNHVIYSFDVSVMDTWTGLLTGGSVVSLTASDLGDFRRLFRVIEEARLTSWVSTPALAQMCLADPRFRQAMLPELRRFLFCGDVLTPQVASQLIERFPDAEVWNTYGPTEATVATTSVRITEAIIARHPQLPIGVAMPGTDVVVEDEAGRRVADGERGEIVIIGPNVSPGYLARPDLTERVFSLRDGRRAYRTGDWGQVVDGQLFFHGRMDNQVKIAGHRVELGDIEVHLAALPRVSAAAVVTTMKDGRPDALHAFVVLTERATDDDHAIAAQLRLALATVLPAYMMPRRFHVVDQMPLSANGKTDRRALAARLVR